MKKKLNLGEIAGKYWEEQQKGEDRSEVWNLGARIEKMEQFKNQVQKELKGQERQIGLLFHEIERVTEALNKE